MEGSMSEYIPGELADNEQGGREYEDWYNRRTDIEEEESDYED
jgi:hypothetical protein